VKQFVQYISYIVGILGFAGIVWTYAAKSTEKDYDVRDLRKDVLELKHVVATKQDLMNLRDTVNGFIYRSENTDKIMVGRLNDIRRNWSQYIKDNTNQLDEFIRYMNGIEFELKMPVRDTVKIKITKQ
jgi:hypothetical protein